MSPQLHCPSGINRLGLILGLAWSLWIPAEALAQTVVHQYDSAGRLVLTTDGTTVVSYQYDPAGNLLSRTVPEPDGFLFALAGLALLFSLGRRGRRRMGVPLPLLAAVAVCLPTGSASAHDCDPQFTAGFPPMATNPMQLTLGRVKKYTIKADVSESEESGYTLSINSNPGAATVTPPPGESSFKQGVYTVRGNAVGSTTVLLEWTYAPTGGNGVCPFTVEVTDPAEDRQTAAAHDNSKKSGDPVDEWTGAAVLDMPPDLYIDGIIPMSVSRYFSSDLGADGQTVPKIGQNWLDNYDLSLIHEGDRIDIAFTRGRGLVFDLVTGSWVLRQPLDIPFQLIEDTGDYVLMNPQDWMRYRFDSQGRFIELMDRNGNALTIGYDELNRTSVTGPFGKGFTFTYDFFQERTSVSDGTRTVFYNQFFSGQLVSVMDARGNSSTYTYDFGSIPGLLTQETTGRGTNPFSQTYDGTGRVATQSDSNSNMWTFSYSGNQTTVTDPALDTETVTHANDGTASSIVDFAGNPFSASYDSAGRRTGLTDRLGDTTTATYHADSGRMTSHTDAMNQTTTFTWTPQAQDGFTFWNLTNYMLPDGSDYNFTHDANGNLLEIEDPNGQMTTYTYNSRGQPITRTQPLLGMTTYTYDSAGMLATIRTPDMHTTSYAYDSLNRLERVDNPDFTFRTYSYDNGDNLASWTDELNQTTTYTYDENGNRTSVMDPDGVVSNFTWDGNDRLLTASDALGTTTYSYDSSGRLATTTHSNGESATIGWNAAGFPTSLTDAMGATTQFAYDAEGAPQSITNPLNRTWMFQTDALGEIQRMTTPLGNRTHYTYDSRGRLEQITSPEARHVRFEYDPAGSLGAIRMPLGIAVEYTRDAEGQISGVMDANGQMWSRQYDSQGHLESMTDPLGRSRSYSYDDRGRRDGATFPLGSLSITYDAVGNVLTRNYGGGPTLTYTYDELNRVMTANGVTLDFDAAGNISHSNGQEMTYDSAGRVLTVDFEPGESVHYTYNDCGLVESLTDYTGGTTTYTYDAATQLTHVARPNGTATEYEYDDDGRLTRVMNMQGATMISDIQLALDGEGNTVMSNRQVPTSPPLSLSVSASFSYDIGSQLSIAGATYDDNGRRTAEPGRTYSWDGAMRLESYTDGGVTRNFEYDAFGSRIGRTEGAQTHSYVVNYAFPGGATTEISDGGMPEMRYVYLPNGQLAHAIHVPTGNKIFYHFDESGSTSFLTNDAGAITDSYGITPYGEAWDAVGTTFNPFVYHGSRGVLSEGNGLYQMGPRFYHSGCGAFLSEDILSSPTPQGVNPYSFANNNPVNFGEPRASGAHSNSPVADIFTPTNASFLTGLGFEALDHAYEFKRLDQIDQAIKHSRQFPTHNPFPIISDAIKTEGLQARLGIYGNVAGFGIDGIGETLQARKEGKGWVQSGARGLVGGGTGLAIGVASAPVALVDGLTGENLSHSIKQVYRAPEALFGNERDRQAYKKAARTGDYGAAVQVTNRAGEIYADKGVLNTLSGISAQGFWDSVDGLGYAWFGAPEPLTLSKRALERMARRRQSARQTPDKPNGLGQQNRVTRTRHR